MVARYIWFLRMNLLKIKYNFIYFFSLFLYSNLVIADQCPSAQIIKERKISREYEWTIDERRSLEDVLSVKKLYSVRIKNKGEFIACHYSGDKNLLRLDGKPVENNCIVRKKSSNWQMSENGEFVCKDEDLNLCIYEIHCEQEEQKNNEGN